jgi:hypothetical protein
MLGHLDLKAMGLILAIFYGAILILKVITRQWVYKALILLVATAM